MTLEEAVRGRYSVRGFLPDPVPKELMRQIFELAQWAPSGTNIQPWKVYVASGDTRDLLRDELIHCAQSAQKPTPDYSGSGRLGEPWRERRRDCAKAMYSAMSIDWDDREARGKAAMRNFELFDAPHVAFLCMDEAFGMQSAADVGMYAQTLMPGQVFNVGRIIAVEILNFIRENHNMAIGMVIGAGVGALTSLVPYLGPILSPVSIAVGAVGGAIIGSQLDSGKSANGEAFAVGEQLIVMAKKFFGLLAAIFNALMDEFSDRKEVQNVAFA